MRQIEKQIKDKKGEQFQRLTWDALKKSLNGLVNKISQPNIVNVIPEVFNENLLRGRGLLCRSLTAPPLSLLTLSQISLVFFIYLMYSLVIGHS